MSSIQSPIRSHLNCRGVAGEWQMNRIDGESHFENDVPNWIRCGEAKVVDL